LGYKLAERQYISEDDILSLLRLFYCRIDAETAGKYRERNAIITGTDFIPTVPAAVPAAMAEFLVKIQSRLAE